MRYVTPSRVSAPGTRPRRPSVSSSCVGFTHSLSRLRPADLHCAGGQVGVFVLEFPVERQASLLPVVVQEGHERVDLAEGGAGGHLVTGNRIGRQFTNKELGVTTGP